MNETFNERYIEVFVYLCGILLLLVTKFLSFILIKKLHFGTDLLDSQCQSDLLTLIAI